MGQLEKIFSGESPEITYQQLSPQLEKNLIDFFELLKEDEESKLFHPHPFTREEAHLKANYTGQDLYFVQSLNDTLIGYGMLRGWDEGYAIPSLGIATHPGFRGQGLGEKFMEFLHTAARNKKASQVRLTVYRENTAAIHLYTKLGYKFSAHHENTMIGFLSL